MGFKPRIRNVWDRAIWVFRHASYYPLQSYAGRACASTNGVKTAILQVTLLLLAFHWSGAAHPRHTQYRCEATAFSKRGPTQLGVKAQTGVVAADPAVFPLGTLIRVSNAGRLSGTYVVTDTGSKVIGRHIDIFVPSTMVARRFGKKLVTVRVLRWGGAETAYSKAAR